MPLTILGMGTTVPPASFTRQEGQQIARSVCCRSVEHSTWLPVMYSNTGIEKRHTILDQAVVEDLINGTRHTNSIFLPKDDVNDEGPTTAQRMEVFRTKAPELAYQAAKKALAESGLQPAEITHLVTVSCTGFSAPGFDVSLIRQLGLRRTTERTHIGYMGCHGALNGLRVARAYADADQRARVLVCAVELCGLHGHYNWDPEKVIANALFADGAAAVVGVPSPALPAPGWHVAGSGSCLLPDSEEAMTWNVGNHGFRMTLSKKVPTLIATHLRPWLIAWLADHGLRLEDVASWAAHPGGPRILEAVEESLGLPRSATRVSREVFASHGNMSSPTVLFIIERLRQADAPRPCVSLGFGPGLNAEATLLL